MNKEVKVCSLEQDQLKLQPFSPKVYHHITEAPAEEMGEEVKTDLNSQLKVDEDDSDFQIKEESSHQGDSDFEENVLDANNLQNYSEIQFKSVLTKNYRTITVKEEPVEDLKTFFKESLLEYEKQKFHQQILENILQNSEKVNLKDLQEHYIELLREAANIEIFICSICEYQTLNLTNLNCHLLAIHNGKLEKETFKCNKCDYKSNFKTCIRKHWIKHEKREKKRKKSMDDFLIENDFDSDFDNEEPLSSYVESKKKEKREKYPCPKCSYQGRSEEGLKRHLTLHKDKTKCDLCSFQAQNKSVLKKHKETHFVDKYYVCYECSYKNGNKTTLGRHLLNEHKIVNEASKRSKICEICSFACSNSNALKIHYTSHKSVNELKEEEIFKCPEDGCNHQTKLKNHLMVHMKVHEPPKFVCETCGLASRRKQTYEDHISTHKKASEIEWLHCPICPYRARIKAHLRSHIKKGIHGEPSKRHFRLRYREGEDAIPKRIRLKKDPNAEKPTSEKTNKAKRKRKPKPKNNASLDEAIVNFGELASAFFRNEVI